MIKIAEREERRLVKAGLLDTFNGEFEKLLQYGALVELSETELSMWSGPRHYVSLQHVINEESSTTPLRIVTNSSLSDRKGLSLNGILMKGHDTLSDQWDVLTRWRTYERALCSDVTKAYYSLKTGELESICEGFARDMGTRKSSGAYLDLIPSALVIQLSDANNGR